MVVSKGSGATSLSSRIGSDGPSPHPAGKARRIADRYDPSRFGQSRRSNWRKPSLSAGPLAGRAEQWLAICCRAAGRFGQ
jgi:hypothetical protein